MPLKCYLCQSKEVNDVEFGEFMHLKNIAVHYFCLLLTHNLQQRGRDDQGILGFLHEDIVAARKQIAKLKCIYCKKSSANISCQHKMNRKGAKKHYFHLACGVKFNCLFRFADHFPSYCALHSTRLAEFGIWQKHSHEEICIICQDSMEQYNPVSSVIAPCCKSGWFHKKCIMNFAKTAGYFFKCPLCNDNKTFRQQIKRHGVFIPDQDAAWECDSNAFNDLLESPRHCNICDEVKYNRKKKPLLIKICCKMCGAFSAHIGCWKEKDLENMCPICLELENSKIEKNNQSITAAELPIENVEEVNVPTTSSTIDQPDLSNYSLFQSSISSQSSDEIIIDDELSETDVWQDSCESTQDGERILFKFETKPVDNDDQNSDMDDLEAISISSTSSCSLSCRCRLKDFDELERYGSTKARPKPELNPKLLENPFYYKFIQ